MFCYLLLFGPALLTDSLCLFFFGVLRVELAVTGRGGQSITILYVGEVATDHHLSENPLMTTSVKAAEGTLRSLGRRLSNAYVPSFMGPFSCLGSFVSLRPLLFEHGFLAERPVLKGRVACHAHGVP